MLKELTDQFQELIDKLNLLEQEYNETTSKMQILKDNLHNLQMMIDRGEKLVQGLSGEKTRWEA
jgi:septal ring factor EnvC (AmiA/AmiB activator)